MCLNFITFHLNSFRSRSLLCPIYTLGLSLREDDSMLEVDLLNQPLYSAKFANALEALCDNGTSAM